MFCGFYTLPKLLFATTYRWSLRQREKILVTFKQLIIQSPPVHVVGGVVKHPDSLSIAV